LKEGIENKNKKREGKEKWEDFFDGLLGLLVGQLGTLPEELGSGYPEHVSGLGGERWRHYLFWDWFCRTIFRSKSCQFSSRLSRLESPFLASGLCLYPFGRWEVAVGDVVAAEIRKTLFHGSLQVNKTSDSLSAFKSLAH
jgi:hypothetical protein